ncbi:MAG: hypothetical protein CBC42_04075 [Betaproteobacteria bacterium TMED82]|nr:MAG: hypothetical protein CBC42_04075 [Betaproteobacteria bacterium TMED82]
MVGLNLNKTYVEVTQYLSERDKLNFDDICSAMFAGRANILVLSKDTRTLSFLHHSLWTILHDDPEESIALYDSKIFENFVADSLLGSYEYAFSRVTKSDPNTKSKEYRRRVLIVKDCQTLDEREIKILIESNKTNALQAGCIIAFFDLSASQLSPEKKIKLFGDNVFNWEPDDLNFEDSVLDGQLNKVVDSKSKSSKKVEKEYKIKSPGRTFFTLVKRLFSVILALLLIFFMLFTLSFLGGYDFKWIHDQLDRFPKLQPLIYRNNIGAQKTSRIEQNSLFTVELYSDVYACKTKHYKYIYRL